MISFVLGTIILLKYRTYKVRQLLFVGLTWIFFVSPWWPDAITFITIIFFNTPLNETLYFFLANGILPVVHITWMLVITDLIFKKQQKIIMAIIVIEAILFEIIFLYLLFTNLSLIGTRISIFYVQWTPFIDGYLIYSMMLFLLTGIIFVAKSFKSENKEIRLKGAFLLLAFITFTIGAFLDVVTDLTELTLVLARTFGIISAFMFYIGFTLPNFVKNLLIKE